MYSSSQLAQPAQPSPQTPISLSPVLVTHAKCKPSIRKRPRLEKIDPRLLKREDSFPFPLNQQAQSQQDAKTTNKSTTNNVSDFTEHSESGNSFSVNIQVREEVSDKGVDNVHSVDSLVPNTIHSNECTSIERKLQRDEFLQTMFIKCTCCQLSTLVQFLFSFWNHSMNTMQMYCRTCIRNRNILCVRCNQRPKHKRLTKKVSAKSITKPDNGDSIQGPLCLQHLHSEEDAIMHLLDKLMDNQLNFKEIDQNRKSNVAYSLKLCTIVNSLDFVKFFV